MKAAVISLTRRGTLLGLEVSGVMRASGWETDVLTIPEVSLEVDGADPLDGPLGRVMGNLFCEYRCLVMIMALGIVIRTLAPHVRDKREDPAVVVMDEGGSFVISALSGHLGGANEIARLIAGGLGSTAVITTATDVNGAPAVDVLARDFKMIPDQPSAVKRINAALARGEKISVYTTHPVPLPESDLMEVKSWGGHIDHREGWKVLVTGEDPAPVGEKSLLLRPLNLVAGVGCKKGAACDEILREIKISLKLAGRSLLCVKAMATIEARLEEDGLVRAARELGVPLLGFSAEELREAIERHDLSKSDTVLEKMGVGGVCEPAAMLACRKGKLLARKRRGAGITVALAEEESGWWE